MPSIKNFYDNRNIKTTGLVIVCIGVLILTNFEATYNYVKDTIFSVQSILGTGIQTGWTYIHDGLDGNGFLLFVVATQLFGIMVFVTCNFFFAVLDITGRPKLLLKYKVQDQKQVPVPWDKYKKCLQTVAFNNIVTGTVFQLSIWPLWKWRGIPYGTRIPSLPMLLIQLIIFTLVEEVLFYYLHRLFHCNLLYKSVHKTHHEWTAPVGIAASYCHPLEHFVVNLFPITAGPLLLGECLGNHLLSEWVWLAVSIMVTMVHHSGYHIPFLPSSEHHDFHHSKFNQMYGVIGILDRLHGTDGMFRQHTASKRHFILLGTASAKEIVTE